VSTLIWATGGGHGHRTRGQTLGERLVREGEAASVTVVHSGADSYVDGPVQTVSITDWAGERSLSAARSRLAAALRGVDRLIVDTFPLGVDGALRQVSIPDSVETVLVARWIDRAALPRYDAQVRSFDSLWFPYDRAQSEWDHPPVHRSVRWLGPITRPLRLEGTVDTLVIGEAPHGWTPDLEAAVADGGRWVRERFDALPRAERVIALACGYNLAWELVQLGYAPIAFHPLPRRYDDQFMRAARLGTPLYHRADLERFLRYPSAGREEAARC
jgi:hypothetical protein